MSNLEIRSAVVLQLLGGKWPEVDGGDYSAVDHFRVEDGHLVPYIGEAPADLPDLVLRPERSVLKEIDE